MRRDFADLCRIIRGHGRGSGPRATAATAGASGSRNNTVDRRSQPHRHPYVPAAVQLEREASPGGSSSESVSEEEEEPRTARFLGEDWTPSPPASPRSRLHRLEAQRPSVPPGGAAKRRPLEPSSTSPDSPSPSRACVSSGSARQRRAVDSGQAPRHVAE
eukprot:6790690-Alexandrium_andersonii.AAC.1